MSESMRSRPEGLQVLIAEDIAVNQLLLSKYLDLLSCDNQVAADGEEAVALYAAGDFDLILMDVQMPRMDGVEALGVIAKTNEGARRVPVVAVTAHASKDDRAYLLGKGFDAVITKPFQLKELQGVIARVIAGEPSAEGAAALAGGAPVPRLASLEGAPR